MVLWYVMKKRVIKNKINIIRGHRKVMITVNKAINLKFLSFCGVWLL